MIADGICVGQRNLPVDGELKMVRTLKVCGIIIVKGAVQFEDSVHRRESEAFGQEGQPRARPGCIRGRRATCCCGEA